MDSNPHPSGSLAPAGGVPRHNKKSPRELSWLAPASASAAPLSACTKTPGTAPRRDRSRLIGRDETAIQPAAGAATEGLR